MKHPLLLSTVFSHIGMGLVCETSFIIVSFSHIGMALVCETSFIIVYSFLSYWNGFSL